MSEQNNWINPETGEVSKAPPQMRAPAADDVRLDKNGAEFLNSKPLVSPLSRQPSLKDRIERMVQNGQLAQLIRESHNLMNLDDDDFEAYERNFPDEEVPTLSEIRQMRREYVDHYDDNGPKGPLEAPTGPEETPATPPPSPTEGAA